MQARPLFVLIAVIAFTCLAGSWMNAQQETKAGLKDTLNELLTQRRDVLKQRVDTLESRSAEGSIQIDVVLHARDQLLDAELQLVKTKAERLALFQKRIDNMRFLEDSVKQRYEAGITLPENFFAATAARLQAEIDLAKEQQ